MSEQEANEQRLAEASDPATSGQRLEELCVDPRLRPSVAGNPGTPAQLLETLANDQDERVRERVAGNPNTLWPTLERLAVEFPHAFLHNPVGPLQLLAHPKQIRKDEPFWDALLRVDTVPSRWWRWLLSHPTLRASEAVRLHVQNAGETTHPYGVCQSGEKQTVIALVNLLTPACKQGTVLPSLNGQSVVVGEQILRERLRWLAHSADPKVRRGVAANEHTSVALLRILALDADEEVRLEVVRNKQTPVDLLRTLAQDAQMHRSVAANEHTPVDLLRVLALDRNRNIRQSVAANEHTPVDLLRVLALDDDELVRHGVASNEQAPVDLLLTLALDVEEEVRQSLAMNHQTPAEALRILAQDYDGLVRTRVAGNRRTPIEVLHTLARNRWEPVRRAVGWNEHTPADLLYTLALDTEALVRQAIAGNEHTPVEVLHTLAQDADANVSWLANLTLRLVKECEQTIESRKWRDYLHLLFTKSDGMISKLEQVVSLQAPEPLRQIILTALADDWDLALINITSREAFRRSLWKYMMVPFFPPIALHKLAASCSWQVRYLVALHENTPWETRQRLCQDGNRYVRALARAKAAQSTKRRAN